MIIDTLENIETYRHLNPGFTQAIDFLQRPDLSDLAVGTYELDDRRVFAMVSKDPGRIKEDAQLETHEKYIDIQLVLSGTDHMGWKPKKDCNQSVDGYNEENDIEFFSDVPDMWLPTPGGYFTIFFPEDAHMPLVSSDELHKVVVKIAVNQDK